MTRETNKVLEKEQNELPQITYCKSIEKHENLSIQNSTVERRKKNEKKKKEEKK